MQDNNPRDITNNEDGDNDEEDNRVGFFLDVCLPLLYRGVDADIEKCEKYKRDQAEEDQPELVVRLAGSCGTFLSHLVKFW